MKLESLSDDQLAVLWFEVLADEKLHTQTFMDLKSSGTAEDELKPSRRDMLATMCRMSDLDAEIERRGKVFDLAPFCGYPVLRRAE